MQSSCCKCYRSYLYPNEVVVVVWADVSPWQVCYLEHCTSGKTGGGTVTPTLTHPILLISKTHLAHLPAREWHQRQKLCMHPFPVKLSLYLKALGGIKLTVYVCICMCVCVCERERERACTQREGGMCILREHVHICVCANDCRDYCLLTPQEEEECLISGSKMSKSWKMSSKLSRRHSERHGLYSM